MKKILIAATLSLFATGAMAQTATTDTNNATTVQKGVDSTTTGGQGTGAGADAAKQMPLMGTDAMATGSMTPDNKAKSDGATTGANDNGTTSVNGVDSSTSGGQGTGAGADMAK